MKTINLYINFSNFFATAILFIFGIVFYQLHIPLPWLMGGVVGSFILSLFNIQLTLPPSVRAIILALIGLSMGSLITPQAIQEVAVNLSLFIGIFLFIPLYMAFSTYLYYKIMDIPLRDSFLCSAPGLLSYIVIIAEEKQCDFALIILVHTLRLIFLVIILPLWLVGSLPQNLPIFHFLSFQPFNLIKLILIILFILWVGRYASRLKITAPWLLISIILSAFLLFGFNYKLSVDPLLLTLSQIFIGNLVAGNTKKETLKRPLIFYIKMLLIFALCLLFVIFISLLLFSITNASFPMILLAYSPGGLEAMVLIALALNLNPLLVSALHIIRMIYLSFLIPFIDRLLSDK